MLFKPIGGEFDLSPNLLRNLRNTNVDKYAGEFLTSSGRAALFHILSHLQEKCSVEHLYLPEYICQSVIEIVEKVRVCPHFYYLDDSFRIDFNRFYPRQLTNSVVLLVNYFGLLDLEEDSRQIKLENPEVFVILDNVQAFYEMGSLHFADYAFTSFRKTFPVPDGGWVNAGGPFNVELLEDPSAFVSNKIAGALIKYVALREQIDEAIYLEQFEQGEKLLGEANVYAGISDFTKRIMGNIDTNAVKKRRQKNAAVINEQLRELDLKVLIDPPVGKAPLFIPVYLGNRDEVRRSLFEKRVFLPVHWRVNTKYAKYMQKGADLAAHELSFIVDQRYCERDMIRTINTLKEAL